MRKRRKKKSLAGILFVILGVLCILGAIGLVGYNIWDSDRAEKASSEALDELIDRIEDTVELIDDDGVLHTRVMEDKDPANETEMPVIEADGYGYIGFLFFPSLELTLPVMDTWDYDRLTISPCRYTGSYYTDDLVICGHNYTRHFMPVKDDLKMGDDVYFINVKGERIHYIVVNKETVAPTAIEDMINNMNNNEDSINKWDLTLFTCNTGGQTRAAVRCERVEEN